jgi:acyl-CoA thioesterase YciA
MKDMGEVRIKIVAMPKDTNPAGNIFGGWIMSQIDLAGITAARDLPLNNVVTVAINSIEFKEPVYVGDSICCYAKIIHIGNTSLKVAVEVIAERSAKKARSCTHVTSAIVTYVNVDSDGKKQKIECTKNQKKALGLLES